MLWLSGLLIPVILAAGSAVVSWMRYRNAIAAQTDEHLKAAQEEADRLIRMQAGTQAALDAALVRELATASARSGPNMLSPKNY
jgi:sensor domain CHASE-containing protein